MPHHTFDRCHYIVPMRAVKGVSIAICLYDTRAGLMILLVAVKGRVGGCIAPIIPSSPRFHDPRETQSHVRLRRYRPNHVTHTFDIPSLVLYNGTCQRCECRVGLGYNRDERVNRRFHLSIDHHTQTPLSYRQTRISGSAAVSIEPDAILTHLTASLIYNTMRSVKGVSHALGSTTTERNA